MGIISSADRRIWLASASPRRRELLERLGFVALVRTSEVEERPSAGETPRDYTRRLARAKGLATTAVLRAERLGHPEWLIAADTVVTVDGLILEKPRGDAHALEMLEGLSGREHEVLTSFAVGRVDDRDLRVETVTTRVTFFDLGRADLARYVATGEGRDKAGGYAIQGVGAFLVRVVRGCYSNVVGLPQSQVVAALREVGALPNYPFNLGGTP